MAEFGSLFIESKGKPIQYNNETVIAVDKIPVPNIFEVTVIDEAGKTKTRHSKLEVRVFLFAFIRVRL
ncbi:MAG: hypothetical protein RR527_08650, partial [Clostridia bacterium]